MDMRMQWVGLLALSGVAACSSDDAGTAGAGGQGGTAGVGGAAGIGGAGGSSGAAAGAGGVAGSAGAGGSAGVAGSGGSAGAGGSAGQAASCLEPPGGLALEMTTPFTSTPAEPVKQLLLAAPSGIAFTRMELSLDVTHGGWYAPKPDGAHGIFQITVGNKWASSLYGFSPWRGPPSKLLRVNSNLGLGPGEMSQLQTTKLLEQGKKYHVEYVYDGATLTRHFVITSEGQPVIDIQKQDAVASVTSVAPGYPILLGTELACDGCGPEVPTHGWTFENLCVRLVP